MDLPSSVPIGMSVLLKEAATTRFSELGHPTSSGADFISIQRFKQD
jgi:hypothetical protein